ncbi:hypothetical protein CYMTET_43163 [Cymbomonas tetramitiformis]|uniref:Uncharacterized protein n=1 Tax=Cymbomonas tetramitiformis TaxID=36881 RepID=A0AAE0F0X1_9CHLO|nr:hypothetical protein CYMTET_43163 [Cymbomonas tetramitiformis]
MHELVENIHNIVHAGATENKVENLIDLDTMKAWTRQMQTDSNGQTRGQAWAATLYGEEFTMEHAGGALFGTTPWIRPAHAVDWDLRPEPGLYRGSPCSSQS